jgi:hypothetical protein
LFESIPGKTISATQLALIQIKPDSDEKLLATTKQWRGTDSIVAARKGAGYAAAFTDFQVRDDGFV